MTATSSCDERQRKVNYLDGYIAGRQQVIAFYSQLHQVYAEADEVRDIIAGLKLESVHDPRAMLVWGRVFAQMDSAQKHATEERIRLLALSFPFGEKRNFSSSRSTGSEVALPGLNEGAFSNS